jgi:hypothetical protein
LQLVHEFTNAFVFGAHFLVKLADHVHQTLDFEGHFFSCFTSALDICVLSL